MILVVEDYDDARVALVRLLRCSGYDAIGVADGEQALLFARVTAVPRLVLLDFRMPGIDGLEVLRRMREDPRTAGVPVVIFTADEVDRDAALAAGAQGYVRRASMDWPAVLAEIERHVGRPGARRDRSPDERRDDARARDAAPDRALPRAEDEVG